MTTLINRFAGFPVTSPARLMLGSLVNVAGAVALLALVIGQAIQDAQAREALLASLSAGAATGLGALVLLVLRRPDVSRLQRFMLFAAGMMLAAAVFSLLTPAFAFSHGPLGADVFVAIAAGWFGMRALDRWMPHHHPGDAARDGAANASRKTLQLVVIAIAVHNIPEGFAVGAGFGGGSGFGWATAVSIGIQNIPEGLVVATALWSLGLPRRLAAAGALATGLVEPIGAAVGIAASAVSAQTLPMALGVAGGAMLFVVLDELAPQALAGHKPEARSSIGREPSASSRTVGALTLLRTLLPFAAGFLLVAATSVGTKA